MRKNSVVYYLTIMFSVICFSNTATAYETLVRNIVRHRDFFARFEEYSDSLLNDVEILERGKSIGVVIISPEGFEQHLVYDIASMKSKYANARILSKDAREYLLNSSIRMSDVVKLAKAAKSRAEELRQGWKLYEGKPGNIIPKNPSSEAIDPKREIKPVTDKVAPAPIHTGRGYISKIREDIVKEVSEKNPKDILELMRAELKTGNPEEKYCGVSLNAEKLKNMCKIIKNIG